MRTTSLALVAVLAVGVAASPAGAKSKKHKPITKSYTANAPMPDPTNQTMQFTSVCAQNVPQSFDTKEFTAPAAGKLKVEMGGFTGDWDLLLTDSEGSEVTFSGGSEVAPAQPASESMTAKVKSKKKYNIIACNYSGGPSASVKYTFTYS